MKVLLQNRPDAFDVFGGDSVQMMKTAEYLRKLGVQVDISLDLAPDVGDYDLVHLMNVTRVTFTHTQLRNAKKKKKKVVLSPIYWNTKNVVSLYLQGTLPALRRPPWLAEFGKVFLKSLIRKTLLNEIGELTYNKKLASAVLSGVDCLLPNSIAEMQIIGHDFKQVFEGKERSFSVVPNGVDANIFLDASPRSFTQEYGVDNFVLNVGRFSYRKNQLMLIKALKGTSIPVVFIGESTTGTYYGIKDTIDNLYYKKCMSEADSSFRFLPLIPHDKLAAAYAASKVFVLPSLYETPGLSALEAALCGSNVCVTTGGSTREYFSDLATYCNPYELNSIRSAVLRAYETPRTSTLREHVLQNFTWDKTAKATLEAYEKVLEG